MIKTSSIAREVRSDEFIFRWDLCEIYWNFIYRHVVLSLELNIFLPVAHVMNAGIS